MVICRCDAVAVEALAVDGSCVHVIAVFYWVL